MSEFDVTQLAGIFLLGRPAGLYEVHLLSGVVEPKRGRTCFFPWWELVGWLQVQSFKNFCSLLGETVRGGSDRKGVEIFNVSTQYGFGHTGQLANLLTGVRASFRSSYTSEFHHGVPKAFLVIEDNWFHKCSKQRRVNILRTCCYVLNVLRHQERDA